MNLYELGIEIDEFGSRLWKRTVIANLTNKKKMLQRSTRTKKATFFFFNSTGKQNGLVIIPQGSFLVTMKFSKGMKWKKGILPTIALKRSS